MGDELDPKDDDLKGITEDDDFDDLILGDKKSKRSPDEDDSFESLDVLAEEEDEGLPEDSFDDEDLW